MNKMNPKNNIMRNKCNMPMAPLSAAIALALMANAPNAQAAATPTAAQTSAQAATQAQTQAPQQVTIEIAEPARLSALLEYALNELKQHSSHDIYWPASRLIMHSRDAEVEAQRAEIQQQLERISSQYPEFAATLSAQVSNWQLGAQPYGALNLYKARQSIDHNPLLPAGNYTIILPARPAHIHVYGLTENTGAQPFVAGQTARGFMLSQHNQLHGAHNPEHIYLQRNETSAKVPWGAHNAGGQQLQPGDIIFVGARQSSAWGLLPVGKLADAIKHEEADALEANLQALLRHILPHASPQQAAHTSSHASAQQATQAPSWQNLARPHQLHTSNSWESQNASSLAPYHTEHAKRLTYNNYGHFGLIQMPSARHAPAGAFNISYNDMNEYYRYTASIQMYDWLQASAFFLRVPNRLYSQDPSFSGDTIYTDKGFDVKFRLLKESAYIPEVSVGLVDMAGTGLLSSEYIAASKAFGPLDFTLGVGFGRMGTDNNIKNPFCHIASTACDRPGGFSGSGGKFEVSQWFRGDAALFAGVEYQTPIDRLRLKIEYEGNDYSRDQAGVPINPKTGVNVGATWQLNNTVDLSLNFERGDVLTFGFNIRPNFNRMSQIEQMPNRPPAVLADQGQQPHASNLNEVNWDRVGRRVRNQRAYVYEEFYISAAQGLQESQGEQINPESYRLTVYTHPWRLRKPEEKLDRATRALLAEIPTSISEIEIVEQSSRQPVVGYEIDADAYRLRIANADPDVRPNEAWQFIRRVEPTPRPSEPSLAIYTLGLPNAQSATPTTEAPETLRADRWVQHHGNPMAKPSWGIKPSLRQGYGSPETFMFYQLMLTPFSTWQIDRNWQLHGSLGINLLNNYDKFNFTVDGHQSNVPRVRTFTREYVQNDVWLNRLQASYYKALNPAWHVSAYGGYLEQMFAGVGGEVLYRPLNSAFAYGLDINRVRQRDFDGAFGMRDYEVTTGFASVYYDVEQHVPWLKGGLLTAQFGQFLAGDKGVHLSYQRRFDSGIVLGAFAAFTDMSTAEFGEGSFNKGFFISMPFDLFTISPSRSRLNFGWTPLTRDGGQKLERNRSLWLLTDERSPFLYR